MAETSEILEVIFSAELGDGVYPGISADAYYGIRACSATALKRFVLDSPEHAKAMLDGRLDDDSIEMNKGTALHTALLQPDLFESSFAIGPEAARNTREWKAFAAANPGKTLFKPSERDDVVGMRDRLWSEPFIARLLEACDLREHVVVWHDPATGVRCKMRLDLYSTARGILLDVKTTGQIKRFGRTAWDLGYSIQLAWYARGLAAMKRPTSSVGFLVVEQSCPYTPAIFEPTADWFIRGHQMADEALARWAECERRGVWPGYMIDSQPLKLEVPKWADKQ